MSPLPDSPIIERAARQLYDDELFRKQEVWATSWENTTDAIREECRALADRMLGAAQDGFVENLRLRLVAMQTMSEYDNEAWLDRAEVLAAVDAASSREQQHG